ncbi:MAG: hypothetical protein WA761_02770 [Thermoplasmata archaeon]
MRTYIDITFSSDGPSPIDLAERIRETLGLSFIVGSHDLMFEWSSAEEFRGRIEQVHDLLRDTGAYYRVQTAEEEPGRSPIIAWPPALTDGPQRHPAYEPDPDDSAGTGRHKATRRVSLAAPE